MELESFKSNKERIYKISVDNNIVLPEYNRVVFDYVRLDESPPCLVLEYKYLDYVFDIIKYSIILRIRDCMHRNFITTYDGVSPGLLKKVKFSIYREAIAKFGVRNKEEFIAKGFQWFKDTSFGEFGRGAKKFSELILERNLSGASGFAIRSDYDEIIEKLYVDIEFKDKLLFYKKAIESHGVRSKEEFIAKGFQWFKETRFGPYGSGNKLFSELILERQLSGKNGWILKKDYLEIIEKLYG